jgi:hypothetical protein
MGAGKASWSDWSALAGRRVVLWPDNDEKGRKHMDEIQAILTSLGCALSRIEPDDVGLDEGGDIADLVERLGIETARKSLPDLVAGADPVAGAAAELAAWMEDVIAGRWSSLPLPLPKLGQLSRAAMPGALCLIASDPGAGKSWLALQLTAFWQEQGIRVAVRMLEDDRRAHTNRLLAQFAGNVDLADDVWIRAHPTESRSAMAEHRTRLDRLGSLIDAETDEQPTRADLVAWAESKAKAGARVIFIDPITAAATEREPWAADFTAAMALKRIARQHACTIIAMTHPRGTANGRPSLSAMAGGQAWPRFAHVALWLERHPPREARSIDGEPISCNRTMHILKSRYGRGAGLAVGVRWDEERALFEEVGILAPELSAGRSAPSNAQPSTRGQRLRAKPGQSEDLFEGRP